MIEKTSIARYWFGLTYNAIELIGWGELLEAFPLFFENIQSNPARVFWIVFHRKDSSWLNLRDPEY